MLLTQPPSVLRLIKKETLNTCRVKNIRLNYVSMGMHFLMVTLDLSLWWCCRMNGYYEACTHLAFSLVLYGMIFKLAYDSQIEVED